MKPKIRFAGAPRRKRRTKHKATSKGGRPKLATGSDVLGSKLTRLILGQHNDLMGLPLLILGKHAVAEEMLRRRKAACKEAGTPYNRREQMDLIARDLGMDSDRLANWLNRSKRTR